MKKQIQTHTMVGAKKVILFLESVKTAGKIVKFEIFGKYYVIV